MRILVIGATGALGSMLYYKLSTSSDYIVAAAGRSPRVRRFNENANNIYDKDLISFGPNVREALMKYKPDVIINCIGAIKQKNPSNSECILANSYFPTVLSEFCAEKQIWLIHFSTDCVFSGNNGYYSDDAVHDASDVYGRTKSLGEVDSNFSLTLRTSILGPQLLSSESLLEWLLSQNGTITGFKNAYFSGLTTTEIAKVIFSILERNQVTSGVYNLAMKRISKFHLLSELIAQFDLKLRIIESESPKIDRSLDARRFNELINYNPPNWTEAIQQLRSEYQRYKEFYHV